MKHLVLIMVGIWFAFLTVMQSFHLWERLLYANNFSPIAWSIAGICLFPIALGYSQLFIVLYEHRRSRVETITITLILGVIVGAIFGILHTLNRSGNPLFLEEYIRLDQYLRTQYQTVVSYMDYGNSLLLLATNLWWGIVGVTLLFLPKTRRRKV